MKKDYGLVSIIMPSYNSAKYISESIDSIICQSYINWELLITDDFSTDDSCKIIEQYVAEDNRIRLFRLNKNEGAGVARNKSIKEANGKYIAFCDSDDRWKPEKLESQLSFMNENKIEICYSSYLKCDENNKVCGIVVSPFKISYKDILKSNDIATLTCIYDTSHIGKIYMPKLKKRQDWGNNILLLKKSPMAYGIKDALAYYRVRRGSLSDKKMTLISYNVAIYKQVVGYNTIR